MRKDKYTYVIHIYSIEQECPPEECEIKTNK